MWARFVYFLAFFVFYYFFPYIHSQHQCSDERKFKIQDYDP